MKTNKNSKNIRAAHPSQNDEQAGTGTHLRTKFEITFHHTQYNYAKLIIEAASVAEAEEKADEIECYEVDDWIPVDGDFYVYSVEPVEGGQKND